MLPEEMIWRRPQIRSWSQVKFKITHNEGRLRLLLETDPEKNITAGPTPAQGNAVLSNKIVAPKSVAAAFTPCLQQRRCLALQY